MEKYTKVFWYLQVKTKILHFEWIINTERAFGNFPSRILKCWTFAALSFINELCWTCPEPWSVPQDLPWLCLGAHRSQCCCTTLHLVSAGLCDACKVLPCKSSAKARSSHRQSESGCCSGGMNVPIFIMWHTQCSSLLWEMPSVLRRKWRQPLHPITVHATPSGNVLCTPSPLDSSLPLESVT